MSEIYQTIVNSVGASGATLMAILVFKQGVAAGMLAWGTILKLIQPVVSSAINQTLVYVASTPETDDDSIVVKVLDSKPYRLFAFVMDVAARVKLPTKQSFLDLIEKKG